MSVIILAMDLVKTAFIGRVVVEIEDCCAFGLGNEYSDGLCPKCGMVDYEYCWSCSMFVRNNGDKADEGVDSDYI
jgi:hypothetical protein